MHCSTSSPFSNGPMGSSKSIRDSSGDFAEQGIQSRMMFMSFPTMRIGKLEGSFILPITCSWRHRGSRRHESYT